MVMCPLACGGTYSAKKDRGQVGGSGPGYVLALRQHLRKVKPDKKANTVTAFLLALPPFVFPWPPWLKQGHLLLAIKGKPASYGCCL